MTAVWISLGIAVFILMALYIYGCVNPKCPECGGRKSYWVSPSSMRYGKLRKCYCMTVKDPQKNYKEECKHIFWTTWCLPWGYTDLG